jgi:hypothetical protein
VRLKLVATTLKLSEERIHGGRFKLVATTAWERRKSATENGAATPGGGYNGCGCNWLKLQLAAAATGCGCIWLRLQLDAAATGCGCTWLWLHLVGAAPDYGSGCTSLGLQLDTAATGCGYN